MIHQFEKDISHHEIPLEFTYPFYYQPNELAVIAAEQLQNYLINQKDFEHNFGLIKDQKGLVIGKMFGVLVVQKQDGSLGHLWAFSGKLANSNEHPNFVPPVYDMLSEKSFFEKKNTFINEINIKLDLALKNPEYTDKKNILRNLIADKEADIENKKLELKNNKIERDLIRREAQQNLDSDSFQILQKKLAQESVQQKSWLRFHQEKWDKEISIAEKELDDIEKTIKDLKHERKTRSNQLQNELFESYSFLNAQQEQNNLKNIFSETPFKTPPAGSGECAAPKLLQYAYLNNLKPIAMAEFWWGQSPKSEVRQHKSYYPACSSKCKPILGHMLQGLNVEANPLSQVDTQLTPKILYEDVSIVVIEKPSGLLSAPGKIVSYCVLNILIEKYGAAYLVHRLDQDTSGLMVFAKTTLAQTNLQEQFARRTIKKRYVAKLTKAIDTLPDEISLPLTLDIHDRPRQKVCFEEGKESRTRVNLKDQNKNKVYFYPITGRTHQLRVHAAHNEGLNNPIAGDELYGSKNERLMLHAEFLQFKHPTSGKKMVFQSDEPF